MVTTNKGQYSTNKLILSVPLGVLKAKHIEFVPQLPSNLQQSIDGMGFGVYENIQVSFRKKFW